MSQFTSEVSSFRQNLLPCQLQETSLESILHYLQITVNISFPEDSYTKVNKYNSTILYFEFHILNDQVNPQFAVSNQGNSKQKQFFLQYFLLKYRVMIAVLCPRRSLFLWPSHECRYMHFFVNLISSEFRIKKNVEF